MEKSRIKEKLHHFIDSIEERKAEAISVLFEDQIEVDSEEYSAKFKEELESRYRYYKEGGKMTTADEAETKIKSTRKSSRQDEI